MGIIVADMWMYDKLVGFFGLDILSDYEEIYGGKTVVMTLYFLSNYTIYTKMHFSSKMDVILIVHAVTTYE